MLIALSVADHEHHERARTWLGSARRFATTPSTQGSLVRFLVRVSSTEHALDALDMIRDHERHEFWPDDAPYDRDMLRAVTGHRQVTDAYLAAAAGARGTTLATFDRGLSRLRPADTELLA